MSLHPPLNITQTASADPFSTGDRFTGGFFTGRSQPEFQGAHDLLGDGATASISGTSIVAVSAVVLALVLLMRKK